MMSARELYRLLVSLSKTLYILFLLFASILYLKVFYNAIRRNRLKRKKIYGEYVDVEGTTVWMTDEKFHKTIHENLVFFGPDNKIHIDKTPDNSYYNKIMKLEVE